MKYTKIPESTFQNIQLNAGVLLSSFTPTNATVVDTNIIGATTGGINFNAAPSFIDFGADIDNCPKNTKELMQLDDWDVSMSGSFVTITPAAAGRLVSVGDVESNKITPRRDLNSADFEEIWWVGDYSDKNGDTNGGFVAIHMMNTLNTGGFQIQTGDKSKGTFQFNFKAHYSIDEQDVVPFEVYVQSGTAEPNG